MTSTKALEDMLLEGAGTGNQVVVEQLIAQGVNVNAKNNMNGWTALHWAAKRGYSSIIQTLVSQGADIDICNNQGEKPSQVASDPSIVELLGGCAEKSSTAEKEPLPITPNYIRHPVFPHTSVSGDKSIVLPAQQTSLPTNTMQAAAEDIVLKIRVANSAEQDFIEVELPKSECSFENLMTLMCTELKIDKPLVQKVRKLPNTIVRKDKDVSRLVDFQELELVLSNAVRTESSRSIYSATQPRNEDIFY